VGTSAFAQLAIDASEFYPATWAKEKGLYYELFEDADAMDKRIEILARKLINTNPEARKLIKQATWKGTEDWDDLLAERAGMSGQLVLSDYTKKELERFKDKE
ncbi:MAG: enoyl-CoA hydratase/isomerase family protein, partial [Cyclobacteriaceae bacterium]